MANLKQQIDQIFTNQVQPRFYGIIGKEQVRVERVWQHVAQKLEIFNDGKWQLPIKKIKLSQTTISDIKKFINAGAELSLFSNKQIFIIEQLEKVTATQVDQLLKILELNNDNYYFFLGNNLLKTSRLRKAIEKTGAFLEIPSLKSTELNRWVTNEFKLRDLTSSQQINRYLIELSEESVDQIVKMIDLLELYSNSKEIKLADCQDLFIKDSPAAQFEWSNAISNGEKAKATNLILKKLNQGDLPFPMLGLIFKNYLGYYLISKLSQEGLSQQEIKAAIKANPHAFKYQYNAAKNKSPRKLREDIRLIIKTDTKFKNKSFGYDELLTNLVENLS